MAEPTKPNPDSTLSFCAGCKKPMPCGCPSGVEIERLRLEVTNLRLLLKVQAQVSKAQAQTVEVQQRLLDRMEKRNGK